MIKMVRTKYPPETTKRYDIIQIIKQHVTCYKTTFCPHGCNSGQGKATSSHISQLNECGKTIYSGEWAVTWK